MADDRSTWLSHDDYLAAFRADAARLATLLRDSADDAPVPTCPGWTAVDLARHVGDVYAHKVAVLTLGRAPKPGEWPLGDDLDLAAALDRHDAVVAELADRLAGLDPAAHAWTWMEGAGEQTVGAWARRMAQEALVHRVDAEAATGTPLHPAAPGLAADGVQEVLTWMAGDPDVVADGRASAGRAGTALLDHGDGALLVDLADGAHTVRAAESGSPADVVLRGDALGLDLELWGRLGTLPAACRGDLDAVDVQGDPRVLERLRARIAVATQ
ncbi:maleylpyruvate isomerase family mycothiol-dependent enzyme [Angustibacter peucedani]